jgi:hypothetical protein
VSIRFQKMNIFRFAILALLAGFSSFSQSDWIVQTNFTYGQAHEPIFAQNNIDSCQNSLSAHLASPTQTAQKYFRCVVHPSGPSWRQFQYALKNDSSICASGETFNQSTFSCVSPVQCSTSEQTLSFSKPAGERLNLGSPSQCISSCSFNITDIVDVDGKGNNCSNKPDGSATCFFRSQGTGQSCTGTSNATANSTPSTTGTTNTTTTNSGGATTQVTQTTVVNPNGTTTTTTTTTTTPAGGGTPTTSTSTVTTSTTGTASGSGSGSGEGQNGSGTGCEGEDEECEGNGRMGTIEKGEEESWWESEYPNGFSGVYSEWMTDNTSGFSEVVNRFKLPYDSGTPPEWSITVGDFGSFNLAPPPFIWTFIRFAIILTAAFTCRRLIFGG